MGTIAFKVQAQQLKQSKAVSSVLAFIDCPQYVDLTM